MISFVESISVRLAVVRVQIQNLPAIAGVFRLDMMRVSTAVEVSFVALCKSVSECICITADQTANANAHSSSSVLIVK